MYQSRRDRHRANVERRANKAARQRAERMREAQRREAERLRRWEQRKAQLPDGVDPEAAP